MTTVRFTNICDHCGKRGEEYVGHPSCRDCCDDVCEECRDTDKDEPETNTSICKKCAKEEQQP